MKREKAIKTKVFFSSLFFEDCLEFDFFLLSNSSSKASKKRIFFTRFLVTNKVCGLVIDRRCWINMTSTTLMEKLELLALKHPQPYILDNLNDLEFKDMGDAMVIKQALLSFMLVGYEDEVLFDVVPSKKYHLLLGHPWKYQCKEKHERCINIHSFLFDNGQITLVPEKLDQVTYLKEIVRQK